MTEYSLRDVTDNDHEFLLELHNDPAVLKNLTHPEPITLEQHLDWWEKIKDNPNQRRFIFCIDGERIGFTKFYSIDYINKNCVLGADIHKDHRGKGHAKHMWNEMLAYCFNTLQLHRVSLSTADYNAVAHNVYKTVGFVVEGRMVESLYRDGVFCDQICMYMLANKWVSS